ncbi:MAG: aspartate/glutamate racemase family protein [Alphaproteobacteria bacterium]
MKTIGMLGGMSAESTAHYYRVINEMVRERLGGVHSAQILMYSFDFAMLEELQRAGDWQTIGRHLVSAARSLEGAGADFMMICANTMHVVAPEVESALKVPLLSIIDPTADAIRAAHLEKVALLGTSYTMELGFFQERLARFGIEAIVPEKSDRVLCHRIIFEELVRGIITAHSKQTYRGIIDRLVKKGAQAVILGCTELTLIITKAESSVPLFDTMMLHAQAAVDLALED